MNKKEMQFVHDLLRSCDVEIGGTRPWDIQVHNENVFRRVLADGSLGLGEAYMDGWWDTEALDTLLERILGNNLQSRLRLSLPLILLGVRSWLTNRQRSRVREVGEKHYDIGNDLYAQMLDPRMIYSCGYWRSADTLAAAQEAKLDLICRKIGLREGMRVLDIGSGWGGFLKFAAERYGVEALGITISKEQMAHANATRGNLPIETRLMDYMELEGKYDRIVSIGMFEHVGYKNYDRYFKKVSSLLSDDGLFLLHTIGGNNTSRSGDPWIEKYIFPHGMLPSSGQITAATEGRLVTEDWHNFGSDYDKTLMAWYHNFEASWPALAQRYDERFHRMWRFYLLLCAAVFRVRHAHLWQIVFSRNGIVGGYNSVR
ncbi:cyclopropane fatty acyl phospholipid synthase [Rhizobium sp. 16-449-1b]|uniref:cyclopropane fatty acyl phospholipid synthase n=1 Tax=Rhizobium sp. 16-449-1b TaxID=2819989 RepID=UPI001ADA0357|nr:cyclopropane fatty acyl phospholipid synthase [Rhizobium sp. 16-449-1b]MBO9198592.1 cyclopropane fatty acyl phospholipid synthase [Rhizobium sp. 16-449-1b]